MISFGLFQVYIWGFIVMGWVGTIIISVASIKELFTLLFSKGER